MNPVTRCMSRRRSAFEGRAWIGNLAGVHESQSRLWENVVAQPCLLGTFLPALRDAFPDQFRQIGFETFYRAINKVQRS